MALTKATLIDLNSNELALDLDGDTTLHSSTDDQIDIKIAGADDFTFTANAFNALAGSHITLVDNSQLKVGADTDLQIYHDGTNSYIANKTGALKIATETSGIAITIGHTTSEVTIADNVTVTGNINVGGTLTFVDGSIAIADLDIDGGTDIGAAIVDADLFIVDDGAGGTNRKTAASRLLTYAMAGTLSEAAQTNITSLGTLTTLTVDDITINGSTISDAGDLTLDSGNNIVLDADGGDVRFKDGGTLIGSFALNDDSNLNLHSHVSDKDVRIKGNDGGSTITALTLDMSAAGAATFNSTINSGAITSTGIVTGTGFTAGSAVLTEAELEKLDGITNGAGAANKALVLDGSADVASGLRNLTASGTITSGGIVTGTGFTAGSAVLAEAELELLDGLTAGTAIASKVVTTDANIDTSGQRNLTISGELDAATGDFSGAVDVAGALTTAAITASGIVTGTAFTAGSAVLAEAELELLDGLTAGTAIASKVVTTDANIDTTGQRNLTISGELDAATLDISGNADIDGTTNLDVVDIDGAVDMASTLQVDGVITTSDGMVITTADNSDTLTLVSTAADNNAGPNIKLFRNSGSPADNDLVGSITFSFSNSNGDEHNTAYIRAESTDVTDGTEDGTLEFNVDLAGSDSQRLKFDSSGTVFNDNSEDQDFRVESNGNANILFVNGGTDRVGIGTNAPDMLLDVTGAISAGAGTDEDLQQWNIGSDNVKAKMTYLDASANRGFAIGTSSQHDFFLRTHNNIGLKVDINGAVTKPLQPAFNAHPTDTQSNFQRGVVVAVAFGTERFDLNSDFSSSTFTAPVTGKYHLSTSIKIGSVNTDGGTNYYYINIATSNRTYSNLSDIARAGAVDWNLNLDVLCDMDANDTATVQIVQGGSNAAGTSDISADSFFSGHLVA